MFKSNSLSWIEISQSALINNLHQFRQIISPKVKIMAVIKANAYGHGLVEVAQAIKKHADWFGVNNLEEGTKLRQLDTKSPILILGYVSPDTAKWAIKQNLSFVVYDQNVLIQTANEAFKQKKKANIHLKIETGTNRQGIKIEQIPEFIKIIRDHQEINLEGIYTHFADIEDKPGSSFTFQQLILFKKAIKILKKQNPKLIIHSACTAAIMLYPEAHFNLVRLGIGLYGLWPSRKIQLSMKKNNPKFVLQPVLNWKTKIAQIKMVKAGETVGYGRAYKAQTDLKIAVIPVGYYDGYDRKLSNCGCVLINNQFASVVGRICMNMFMVDVTDIKNININDEVILIGKQGNKEITVDEIAQECGTINYEIVSRINPLIPRYLVK